MHNIYTMATTYSYDQNRPTDLHYDKQFASWSMNLSIPAPGDPSCPHICSGLYENCCSEASAHPWGKHTLPSPPVASSSMSRNLQMTDVLAKRGKDGKGQVKLHKLSNRHLVLYSIYKGSSEATSITVTCLNFGCSCEDGVIWVFEILLFQVLCL